MLTFGKKPILGEKGCLFSLLLQFGSNPDSINV
jgi:hypothetical protein